MCAEAQRLKDPPGQEGGTESAEGPRPPLPPAPGVGEGLESCWDCHGQVHSYQRVIGTELGPCLGRNLSRVPAPTGLPACQAGNHVDA